MRNLTTNLALLMEWTRVTPKELNRALGIDPSLISRWRTGSRRLSAGSRWCGRLTEYFLQARRDEVTALMARVSPLGLSRGQPAGELLERWLGESAGSWEDREELLFLSRDQNGRMGRKSRPPDAGLFSGGRVVRKLLMEFLDDALAQPGPGEILFFCSEGLEFFTRDERYVQALQEKLQALFKQGKRVRAVLRTNYRPSDVALACGPWLRAHLMGGIQSDFYDDFRPLDHENLLFGLRGRLMVQVRIKNGVPQAAIHRQPESIAKAEAYFDSRARCARPRFVFRFFPCPMDFLRGVPSDGEGPVYLLARLPDLGSGFASLSRHLRLRPEEAALFQQQFWPLAFPPPDGGRHAQTRQVFCEDNIDEALDGTRHLCRPFSEICGRRLYLSTRGLAEQLNEMRWALEQKPGYTDAAYTAAVDSGRYTAFAQDQAGYGLAQWTYPTRKAALLAFVQAEGKSVGDLEGQLDFLLRELKGSYPSVLAALQTAANVAAASDAVLLKFERPADQGEAVKLRRARYAQTYYDRYAAGQKPEKGGERPVRYTNSPLVSCTKLSPNRTSPRTHVIDTITIHCIVGQWTAQKGCDFFAVRDRKASANYVVGKDGSIGLCVEEKDRAWCSSNRDNDQRAVTIEVASDTVHPYAVTPQAYAALLELVTDICRRNGIRKLLWKGDKSLIGQVDKQNMTVHRWFANKACPGDYLYSRHGEIAAEVNRRLGTAALPYEVRITASNLRIREGPGTGESVVGYIQPGVYTIAEEADGTGASKWGKLKLAPGWVSLDFCTKI